MKRVKIRSNNIKYKNLNSNLDKFSDIILYLNSKIRVNYLNLKTNTNFDITFNTKNAQLKIMLFWVRVGPIGVPNSDLIIILIKRL